MKATRHGTGTQCPSCGHFLDASSALDEKTVPKVGDVTICIECETALVYESLDPFILRVAALKTLPADTQVQVAYLQSVIRASKRVIRQKEKEQHGS